jgi:hypothetical protein
MCMTPLARRTSSFSPCSCAYCAIVEMRYFCPCLQMRLHRNLTHLVLLQYLQPSSLPRKTTRPLSSCRPRVHHLVRRHVFGRVISESARFGVQRCHQRICSHVQRHSQSIGTLSGRRCDRGGCTFGSIPAVTLSSLQGGIGSLGGRTTAFSSDSDAT